MKSKSALSLVSAFLILLGLAACGSPEADAPQMGSAESGGVETSAADETPSYEPAYPADVSADGLTEEDVAQQVGTHSHGDGEEHSHADEAGHSHGGGAEHDPEAGDQDHGEEPPHAR